MIYLVFGRRVGGLKSRYNLTAEIQFKDDLHKFLANETESFGKFYSVLDFFPIHINAEVMIEDKWIPADTTFTPEFELPLGYAPTQLGHDPSGYWERGHRGFGLTTESLPLEFWNLYKEIIKAFPGAVKNINDSFGKLIAKGKKILDNIDEKEKHEPFNHYLTGLGMLAKTDIHLQFELLAFRHFFLCLKSAFKTYEKWDTKSDFMEALNKWKERIVPDEFDYENLFNLANKSLDTVDIHNKVTLKEVGQMKFICDVFLMYQLMDK